MSVKWQTRQLQTLITTEKHKKKKKQELSESTLEHSQKLTATLLLFTQSRKSHLQMVGEFCSVFPYFPTPSPVQ